MKQEELPFVDLDVAFIPDQMIAVVEVTLNRIKEANKEMKTDLRYLFRRVPDDMKKQIMKEFLVELRKRNIPYNRVKFSIKDI